MKRVEAVIRTLDLVPGVLVITMPIGAGFEEDDCVVILAKRTRRSQGCEGRSRTYALKIAMAC
jgi:hypothetical protein